MAIATLLAACKGSSEPLGPTATLPRATTTTNPYAVPQVIDEAYVNRVLAGLDAALGDILRMVRSSNNISNEAVDRVEALYFGDYYTLTLSRLQTALLGHFQNYEDPPGDQLTTVDELISSSEKCVFARVSRDFSAVSTNDNPLLTAWVALIPLDPSRDMNHFNPTPWMYLYDGFSPDRSQPENQCDEAS